LRPWEMLDVTISVDYAVTDAAAAEQFVRRLADLVEAAAGVRRYVRRTLRPSPDAAQHPTLHQESADQPA
jgi:hypothetical protein